MDAPLPQSLCACPNGPAECEMPFCPYFHRTVELVGRRWTADILRALAFGVQRFGDLRSTIPDISDRMLSERLKEMEVEGFIARTVIPETPVRIEYHLTSAGRALGPIMNAILVWAAEWMAHTPGE